MTLAAAELQAAIHARLAGDATLATLLGGAKIYDFAPASVAFPYVTFGRTTVYDWSTASEKGTEQILSLNAWSKGQGKKEVLAIVDRLAVLLDDAALTLAGHRLVLLRLEQTEARFDEDIAVHHGLMRFRALTEPN